ncbi:hypothetical protein J4731_25955 [Providencia rettgeri]|nr:hypothetical protein [Providencia rettgeri]
MENALYCAGYCRCCRVFNAVFLFTIIKTFFVYAMEGIVIDAIAPIARKGLIYSH